ncbi:tail fiber assembly [Escherichia coli]|nr:tail fiber assembly [Escherichia coli]
MHKAILNSELIATKAGDVTVYNYDGETREYISTSVFWSFVDTRT